MCREYKLACLNWCASCYFALIVNLIWFADEKMFSVSALSNMGDEVRCIASQKLNHLASSVCWCTVLLQHAKVKPSPRTRKCDRFVAFCRCNCKNFRTCHQQTRLSSPLEQGNN